MVLHVAAVPYGRDTDKMETSRPITHGDVARLVRPGWRSKGTTTVAMACEEADDDGSSGSAAKRSRRRTTSKSTAAQRTAAGRSVAASRAARAAANVNSPAVPWHLLFLACTVVTLDHSIVWDLCSGPFKSMAMVATNDFHELHAFTLDVSAAFSPDVVADFASWNPFEFILAHYVVGDFALLPLHIHQITMRAPEKRMTAAATPTRAIRLPVMTQLRHRESPGK